MIKLLSGLCVALASVAAVAGTLTDEACEELLLQAEQNADTSVYESCDFNDSYRAWNVWAPYVSAHNMKKGIYELCRRYPTHEYGPLYCQKALDLNYGPALVAEGNRFLNVGRESDALEYFKKAVQSGNLSETEMAAVTEIIANLYLNEKSEFYNLSSGMALLKKAAEKRSAEANNKLGYLNFAGSPQIKQNMDEAETYLWRAILLGCPAAEENLGVYYLAKKKQIPMNEATYYMSLQSESCEPFDKNPAPEHQCSCEAVLRQEAFYQKSPYLYLEQVGDELVRLRDKTGYEEVVRLGEALQNGEVLREIRPTLLTLEYQGKRIFINRYHADECVDICQRQQKEPPKRQPITLRPYHLTFTPAECSEIEYFVKQKKLVDETLSYVGKTECVASQMDETTKLLLEQ